MPMPVSLTVMRMPLGPSPAGEISCHPACTVMKPPSGVNFMALESRLFSTRVIFSASRRNRSSCPKAHSQDNPMCCSWASEPKWFTLSSMNGLICTVDSFSCSPFCSRRRKSSNWLTSRSKSRALPSIFSSSLLRAESPALRMSSSSGVMMSASGVRNSWLMLVKKRNLSSSRCCSFCRFRFSCSAIMRERLSAMYSSMM